MTRLVKVCIRLRVVPLRLKGEKHAMGSRTCFYAPPSVWNTQHLGLGSSGNLNGLLVDCLSFVCKKRWESTWTKSEIPAGLQDSPPNYLCLNSQLPLTLPLCSSHSEVLEMLISPTPHSLAWHTPCLSPFLKMPQICWRSSCP